jgi:nicotinamide phosphoribosyltransferase
LSIVIDTHNAVNFIEKVVPENRDLILQRRKYSSHPLTKVVFRPDSPRFKGDRPKDQCLWLIDSLGETFGYTINSKGYRTLNPAVGAIYGDGLKDYEIYEIYETLADNGWDCSCMVVGQGGGALESKRDTQRFAIKPSLEYVEKEGKVFWQSLKKDPLDKSKASKEGHLKLIKTLKGEGGVDWETINHEDPRFEEAQDELITIFKNGELVHFEKFEDIRKRVGLLS